MSTNFDFDMDLDRALEAAEDFGLACARFERAILDRIMADAAAAAGQLIRADDLTEIEFVGCGNARDAQPLPSTISRNMRPGFYLSVAFGHILDAPREYRRGPINAAVVQRRLDRLKKAGIKIRIKDQEQD